MGYPCTLSQDKVEATTLDPQKAVPQERCGHSGDQAIPGVL